MDQTTDSLTPESFSLGENMELITMIPGIGDEISALVTHIGKLEMMCADLVNKVADVKKENEALKTDISTFQDNEKRFEGLSSRMEFMVDQLNANEVTVKSANESSSKTIQALEATLEARLTEIEKQAASTRESLSTRFEDVSSRVVSISSRISNASVDIGCVCSNLEGVTRRVASLEEFSSRVTTLEESFSRMASLVQLSELNNRIASLEEKEPIIREFIKEEIHRKVNDSVGGYCNGETCQYNQKDRLCSSPELQNGPVKLLCCSDEDEDGEYKTYTCSVSSKECSGQCSEGEMCCVGTLTEKAILAAQPKPQEVPSEQVENKDDFSCHDSGEEEDLGPVHTPTPPPTPEHSSESGEPKEQEVTEDSVTPQTPVISTPSETIGSEFVVGTAGDIDELEVLEEPETLEEPEVLEEIKTYDVEVTNGKLFHYGKARLDVSSSSWTLTVSEPFEEVQRGEELHLTVKGLDGKDFEWKPTLAGMENSSDDALAFNFDLLLDGDDAIIVTGKRNVYTNLTFSLVGK